MLNGSRACRGAVLAMLITAAPVAAQAIHGRVVDRATGAPVVGARVFTSGGGDAMSGLDGRFELAAGSSARARLRVVRSGYQPASRVVAAGAAEEVVIALRSQAVALERLLVPIGRTRIALAGSFRTIQAEETPVPLTVLGGRRTLRVTGTVEAPDACHALRAAAERLESELIVVIQARPKAAACPSGAVRLGYQLTVRRLRPGSYPLRVVHQLAAGAEQDVYASPVEVH